MLRFFIFEPSVCPYLFRCIVEYKWGMLILVAMFDIFFSVTTLVLFIRPLTKIIKDGTTGCKAESRDVSKFVHGMLYGL